MPSNPFRRKLKSAKSTDTVPAGAGYSGRRTKTGNSAGFRFEGALFKSHPEFAGEVRAHVIAPGRMLVTAEAMDEPAADPVIASFLAFLSQDMLARPESIRALDEDLWKKIDSLVEGIVVDENEDLGDEDLL